MFVSLFLSPGRPRRPVIAALATALGAAFCLPVTPPFLHSANAAEIVSVTVRERLSRYGGWEMTRRYGEVWVPSVSTGWRPYTVGHWVWTDDGWYWQSDEPFGEIVFHYGRWVYDPDLGWVWVEGDQWAPAWVVWRESDDDVGWVPAPPPDVVVEDSWWCFVPVAAIGVADLVTVVRPVVENRTFIQNTTIINQKIVINEGQNPGSVRIGKETVPINAGPRIARLPAPVARKIVAAHVTPPAKGSFAAAHLDTTKGAELRRKAAELNPATPPLAKPNGIAPANGKLQESKTRAKQLPLPGKEQKPLAEGAATHSNNRGQQANGTVARPGAKAIARKNASPPAVTAKVRTVKNQAMKRQMRKPRLQKRPATMDRTFQTAHVRPAKQMRRQPVHKMPPAFQQRRVVQMRAVHPRPQRPMRPAARPAPRHPVCGPRDPHCRPRG